MTRRALNNKVLTGEVSYRDSFHQMLESVTLPYEECKQILRESESTTFRKPHLIADASLDIGLDPGFKEFYDFCKANNVPVVLVSR
jgi:2-hydroxy-3-keto-5-methylthiopentenyl-1-phosphate phosphatase